jgi:hypothetical protein
MKAEINEEGQTIINGRVINEVIFNEEKSDYILKDRKDFIEILIDWISEVQGSDKELMKEDLKYLINLEDEYIFSSILTNEYIVKSDNEEEFNNICEEILELSKTL